MTEKHTIRACFTGYIVQAIVNNFVPLLFLQFQREYQIPLDRITLLVTLNFLVQLSVDLIASRLGERLQYRMGMILAHLFAAAGLILLGLLPQILPDAYTGILISVLIYAVGGGLLEVLVSPIVEACHTEHKEKTMSLLHSFYCWGHVLVVLLTTAFFAVFSINSWRILAFIWALIPIVNGIVFFKVPVNRLLEEGDDGIGVRNLFSSGIFWVLFIMMISAGASEQAVSQWASALAEKSFGIPKAIGDLAGPLGFAIMMGISRTVYGKIGDRLNLNRFLFISGLLCIASYLIISLVPVSICGILACALCGFSVGIMWPGTFSLASKGLRRGGTAMFALLALAGDIGCGAGPTLVGFVSNSLHENIPAGIGVATIFPVMLIIGAVIFLRHMKKEKAE